MVLEAVKPRFEEKLWKAEFDVRVQSALETSAKIFSIASTARDTELQPTMVHEEIVEDER